MSRIKEFYISLEEVCLKAEQYAESCAFQIELQTGLDFDWKDNCEVKKAIEDLARAYCTVNEYENRLDKVIDDCWCAMFKD